MTAKVVVVGGGIAGLAIAHELRRRGHGEIVVLEADARPGGLLLSARIGGYLCEHAASSFLGEGPAGEAPAGQVGRPAESAIDLSRMLGVDLVRASTTAKRRWIWRGGALRAVPSSPPELFTTDLLSMRGKLRAFLEPFARKAPSGDESVAAFAKRRLGPEIAEALFEPFLLGIFAGDAERLSLASCLPRLARLEAEHGGLLRGLLATRRERRGPLSLWAPRDGVDALPRALAAVLGDAVRTGARVQSISRTPDGYRLGVSGGELEARSLVLAVPPAEAAPLVAPLDASLAARLQELESVGVVVVHAGFGQDEVGHPLDGFGFLVARNERLRCLGCVFESSIWPDRAPAGYVLVRLIYGGARDPSALELGDEALRAVVAADLETVFGKAAPPRMLHIVRHKRAITQYTVGHGARVEEIDRRAAALGFAIGGSGFHGVAVNDCVKDALRVADKLSQRPS